jgi:hypothetical protein
MKKYFQQYRKRPKAILRKRELEHQYRKQPDVMLKRYEYFDRKRDILNEHRRLEYKDRKKRHDIDQADKIVSAIRNGDPIPDYELSPIQKYHWNYNRIPAVRKRKRKYDREYRQDPIRRASKREYDREYRRTHSKSQRRIEYEKKYQETHRKQRRKTYNKWRAKNRERLNALKRERRAKKRVTKLVER